MLTKTEKEWLSGKSDLDYPAPCVRAGVRGLFPMRYCLTSPCDCNRNASPKFCPLATDFRDASVFEARVAAKLATMTCDRFCPDALNNRVCRRAWADRRPMYECRLKRARLEVEEEMGS